MNRAFWHGRRVLVTGHTGFKGSWLTEILLGLEARVTGLALDPEASPNLFDLLRLGSRMDSVIGDVRDERTVSTVLRDCKPEFVFHLAAQALVRASYERPIETFATNVMGTAHVLEAVRSIQSVRGVIVVTSDKCYENREWLWPYRETDHLGGRDPYSASKAAAELVAAAYRASFHSGMPVATARAGNVIGGGDWSRERLVPDIVAAASERREPVLRFPHSVRPWQHVLEPLSGYLMLAERIQTHGDANCAWNFGPDSQEYATVAHLTEALLTALGRPARWAMEAEVQPAEAARLRVDASRAREILGWRTRLHETDTVAWTARWYRDWIEGNDMLERTQAQISEYLAL